jgi:hypothetical protein
MSQDSRLLNLGQMIAIFAAAEKSCDAYALPGSLRGGPVRVGCPPRATTHNRR